MRIEKQTGTSDVGAGTVDTTDISPRISGSYSLTSDSKTILVGSDGRFYDGILQGFSDAFAAVPQQTNFSHFAWNGSRVRVHVPRRAGREHVQSGPRRDAAPHG